jgi:hypothetical protein
MVVFRHDKPFNQADFIEIPFSYFDRVQENKSYNEFLLRWPDLVHRWSKIATKVYSTKTSAPLVSPTHFCSRKRKHDLAKTAGMVMLDSDDEVSLEEMVAILEGIWVAAIIYTSARNRPEEPRLRLMVPLERLVSPRRYGEVARAIVRVIKSQLTAPDSWKIDTTKYHCGDLFYVPGRYQRAVSDDGEEFIPVNDFRSLDGEIWDAATWIGVADAVNPVLPDGPHAKRAAATVRTQRLPSSEIRFDRRSKWSPETHCREKIADYLSLSDGRQAGLFGLMSSIACSAYYWRYDLSDGELAGIADDIQRRNSPRRPYPFRKLLENAAKVIGEAPGYVGRQERWPESRDTLAEQLAAIAAMQMETDDSCARLEAFIGGADR